MPGAHPAHRRPHPFPTTGVSSRSRQTAPVFLLGLFLDTHHERAPYSDSPHGRLLLYIIYTVKTEPRGGRERATADTAWSLPVPDHLGENHALIIHDRVSFEVGRHKPNPETKRNSGRHDTRCEGVCMFSSSFLCFRVDGYTI